MLQTGRNIPVITGLLQIGTDAPGLFLRNEDALTLASNIRQVLRMFTADQVSNMPPIKLSVSSWNSHR